MDDVFSSGQIEEEVFPHKIGFSTNGSGSSSSRDTNSVPVSDLPTFDSSNVTGTEEFPIFNSTPYENDLFTDQSTTTEDQAEFITHTSTTAKNNNSSTRGSTTSSSTGSSNDSTAQKTQLPIPRRQRGNSNDRSRMRAEEICQEDINFVCELTDT
jgi:hypothetical protein